jgi:pimeloyl-ACP methyl ester carboxylesterase
LAAAVNVPTLLLIGSESPEDWRQEVEPLAAALPEAEIAVLTGQAHSADVLVPELVAEQLLDSLGAR